MKREAFSIGGQQVAPGTRATIDLPVSVLSDHTPASMSVHVAHGKRPGPVFFVSAAVHGDEVIGVEIVRRLLRAPSMNRLHGTLLAVPIVNAFGFINHSRYLPDRRDLNRCFPGSEQGSLAARLANLFVTEIVARCEYGVDLHSAAIHRTNLPQVRVSASSPETMELADAFGAPLILTSKIREGSLRETAGRMGAKVILYEAGEGLRFDETAVRAGVTGILRVMHHLGMIASRGVSKPKTPSIKCNSSNWLRAPAGGLLRIFKDTGEIVEPGDVLGIVTDPFGESETAIVAEKDGLLVGRVTMPVINEGDGLFHVARLSRPLETAEKLGSLSSQLMEDAALFDEDEII